ncbi:uncharacterized protein [Chelonus insularis]|uniref:uncharacterized protein n=1 Tax=Chelonus insularis TaxID=460826 RepID=UPI00158BA101|nr:uncharacterized protein LOC118063730 [Chelonus insularis]
MLGRLIRPVARVVQKSARGYHKEQVPFKFPTMDELPVPQGSWQEQYNRNQKTYNAALVIGIALLAGTITFGNMSGALYMNSSPPNIDIPYNDYSKK